MRHRFEIAACLVKLRGIGRTAFLEVLQQYPPNSDMAFGAADAPNEWRCGWTQ
jgi:hypothetical protein